MPNRFMKAALLTLASLFLWAPSTVFAAASASSTPGTQCSTCSTTFQCADGLKCEGARCRGENQCCLDLDCPTGQRCQDHQCKPAGGQAGRCGECETAFQCAEGLSCISARCKGKNECCLNQDCPAGQSCENHQCKISGGKVNTCGQCTSSFECANGVSCSGARCKNADQCCLDQDCPAGQTCQDHRCGNAVTKH